MLAFSLAISMSEGVNICVCAQRVGATFGNIARLQLLEMKRTGHGDAVRTGRDTIVFIHMVFTTELWNAFAMKRYVTSGAV